MSVLKVTGVQAEEVEKHDEVVAGQVRMTSDREFTVLIVNAQYNRLLIRESESPDERFLTVILNSPNDFGSDKEFCINEYGSLSSGELVSRMYPIILDAELTYKEAK